MTFAVVSTSINENPIAYQAWSGIGDLYVAGDLNTPPELADNIDTMGGVYLAPEQQMQWACSEDIGWRNIQRRNIAILAAIREGYDYIITVDDDNTPSIDNPQWFRDEILTRMHSTLDTTFKVTTDSLWFNPGRLADDPYRQRGLPASYRDAEHTFKTRMEATASRVGVLQLLITGDPDTDAVQRIVQPVDVTRYWAEVYVTPGVYAPFNSQATVWPRKYVPLMAVLPHCQRYDDIYGSLIAQRIMHSFSDVVMYGKPYVHQDRNPHNLASDLRAEVNGMSDVHRLVELINKVHLDDGDDTMEHYYGLVKMLHDAGILTMSTLHFAQSWLADIKTTGWSAE